MEKHTEKQDSIKLSRTSKGLYSWDIKLYFDDYNRFTNAEETIQRIKQLDQKMRDEFNGTGQEN